jgi:hypothetical protein
MARRIVACASFGRAVDRHRDPARRRSRDA